MADDYDSDGDGHGRLYFLVGALVVALGVGAFFLFGGKLDAPVKSGDDVRIEAPKPGAPPSQAR